MPQLIAIQLDDDTVIYLEAEDNVTAPSVPNTEETTRTAKGASDVVFKNFQALQSTIRAYTDYTLNAFNEISTANIEKVTLEFGIKVAGEGGVPYITKVSGECNLKITVQCSFKE